MTAVPDRCVGEVKGEKDMPGTGGIIFVYFICFAFMAVGILGIYRKIKFSESIRSMHKLTGVMVDSTVCQQHDEDNLLQDYYFPVYEYDWGGETKRLYSTTNALSIKIGRKVHILIDPQTENAICLEEEIRSNSFLLLFGIIGLLTFVLLLLLCTGIIS